MHDTGQTYATPWAAYINGHRSALRLTPIVFGKLLGFNRQTIHRWETGENTPVKLEVLTKVAAGLNEPLDTVLRAAGVDPESAAVAAQRAAAQREDEALKLILEADVSPAVKATLAKHLEARRAEFEQAELREIEILLQAARKL